MCDRFVRLSVDQKNLIFETGEQKPHLLCVCVFGKSKNYKQNDMCISPQLKAKLHRTRLPKRSFCVFVCLCVLSIELSPCCTLYSCFCFPAASHRRLPSSVFGTDF